MTRKSGWWVVAVPVLLVLSACAAPARSGSGEAGAAERARDRADPRVEVGSERLAVERAVLDYVEGFYEGDASRFERSVSPQVHKYGYWRRSGDTAYTGAAMDYAEFLKIAEEVRAGNALAPPGAPKEVVVLDVQERIASAKLTADWGIDYLLLARQEGRWRITHVLWQGRP
jgi:hypothetical protein